MLNQYHKSGELKMVSPGVYDMWLQENQPAVIENGAIRTRFGQWELGRVLGLSEDGGKIKRLVSEASLPFPGTSGKIAFGYHEIASNPMTNTRFVHTRTKLAAKGALVVEEALDELTKKFLEEFEHSYVLRVRKWPGMYGLEADDPYRRATEGIETIGAVVYLKVCVFALTHAPAKVYSRVP